MNDQSQKNKSENINQEGQKSCCGGAPVTKPTKKSTCCACEDCTCVEGSCTCKTGEINCQTCEKFVSTTQKDK